LTEPPVERRLNPNRGDAKVKRGSRGWLVLIVTFALGSAALASSGGGYAAGTSSFPCRWNWDLQAGLRDGYVTAGASADCGARSGSLTLSARLLRWNPKSKRWHVDKAQTRTWRDLRAHRYIELAEPCVTSTVRAVFSWILRDTGGTVVARKTVKTGPVKVPGPGCKIGIG
jgi:hypothetical protein